MEEKKPVDSWLFEPLFLMGLVSFLALGLYWGRFGFFWDDWAIYWWAKLGGLEGLLKSTGNDRITVGYLAWLLERLFAFNPLALQIVVWSLWLGAGMALYATLRRVWPEQRMPALAASLLFLVYPGFSLLPVSIVAINLVLSLGLEITSICLSMLYLSARTPPQKVALALGSIALGLAAWNIYEGAFFIEPLRAALVLIWSRSRGGRGGALGLVLALVRFWPWWAAEALYLGGRVFLSSSKRGVSQALSAFSAAPGEGLVRVLVDWINALVFVWIYPPLAKTVEATASVHIITGMLVAGLGASLWVLCTWGYNLRHRTAKPEQEDAGPLGLAGPVLVMAVAAAGIIYYSLRAGLTLQMPLPQLAVGACLAAVLALAWWRGRARSPAWAWQWVVVGAMCSLIGLALLGFANKHPVLNNLRDRWNLPAIVGACIFIVGGLGLLRNRSAQAGFVSFLLGLGLLFHYGNGYQFLEDWKYQRSLAWQLWQRAPQIDPGTILIIDPGTQARRQTFKYYSVFGLTSALYSLNGPEVQIGQAILGVGKDKDAMQNLAKAAPAIQGSRQTLFPVDWSKVLVVSLADQASCLYVADRKDPFMPDQASALARRLASYSSREHIKQTRGPDPPRAIFGDQPCDWCSYYQRAQLARQFGQWQAVADLYMEARGKGLSPNRVEELLPFIEGLVKTGRLTMAEPLAAAVKAQHVAFAQVEAIMAEARP